MDDLSWRSVWQFTVLLLLSIEQMNSSQFDWQLMNTDKHRCVKAIRATVRAEVQFQNPYPQRRVSLNVSGLSGCRSQDFLFHVLLIVYSLIINLRDDVYDQVIFNKKLNCRHRIADGSWDCIPANALHLFCSPRGLLTCKIRSNMVGQYCLAFKRKPSCFRYQSPLSFAYR